MTTPDVENPYEAPRTEIVAGGVAPIEVPETMTGKFTLAWRLLVENGLLISGIVLTVGLPANLLLDLSLANRPQPVDFDLSYQLSESIRYHNGIDSIFGPLVAGSLLWVLRERLEGRKTSYRRAFQFGLAHWGGLFLARLVAGLIMMLGFLALILPGIVLAIRYLFLDPVVVLEDQGIVASRARSATLVEGCWVELLISVIFVWVIIIAVGIGLVVLTESIPTLDTIATSVAGDCLTDIIGTLSTILIFLYYYEATHKRSNDNHEADLELILVEPHAQPESPSATAEIARES